MKIPGWLYSLLLLIALSGGRALLDSLPNIPEIAGEWWLPATVGLITLGLSWLEAQRKTIGTRSMNAGFSWKKFWLG